MKKFICGLSAALLFASLTACSTPQADQTSEPNPTLSAVQTEAVSTPAPAETEPQETNTLGASDGLVTEDGITLSSVIISDKYERHDNQALLLGTVGFLYEGYEDGYGYSSFWCYVIPDDATITFNTAEQKDVIVECYTIRENPAESWLDTTYDTVYIGSYTDTAGTSENSLTLTKMDIKGAFPEFNLLCCKVGSNYPTNIMFYSDSPLTASDSAPAASVPVALETQAPIEPLPNTVNAATASNSEETNSLKDDIDKYPADPSIIPELNALGFWDSDYVGEIEGYFYLAPLGYYPGTIDSLKDDIDRYPADPSIVPDIPEGARYWKHEYVGEIEGYVYSIGQGYFPEGGSFTYIEPESHLPDFYDIVDP